jgi:hypothetical protein
MKRLPLRVKNRCLSLLFTSSLLRFFFIFWLLLRHGKFKVNEKFVGELLQNSIRKMDENHEILMRK